MSLAIRLARSRASFEPTVTVCDLRIGGDDVERLRGGDAKAFALADGEVMRARVAAEFLALAYSRSRLRPPRAAMPFSRR